MRYHRFQFIVYKMKLKYLLSHCKLCYNSNELNLMNEKANNEDFYFRLQDILHVFVILAFKMRNIGFSQEGGM